MIARCKHDRGSRVVGVASSHDIFMCGSCKKPVEVLCRKRSDTFPVSAGACGGCHGVLGKIVEKHPGVISPNEGDRP